MLYKSYLLAFSATLLQFTEASHPETKLELSQVFTYPLYSSSFYNGVFTMNYTYLNVTLGNQVAPLVLANDNRRLYMPDPLHACYC
jgi:hypothetical protein